MNIDQERRALELLNEVLDIPRSELTAYLDNIGESVEVRTRLDELLSMDTKTGDLNIDCHSYIEEVLEKANLIGKQIGAYRIVEEIGRGGMGGVFRGQRMDGVYEKDVAIKVMDTGLLVKNRVDRFRQEQRILAHLEHPNIAKLLDAGISEKTPYLIMELIDGVPILAYCQQKQLKIRERLVLFKKVCEALQYAHGHLIVHRDLKPANILVTRSGEPILLDFGIAKLLDDKPQLTQTHAIAMTPMYASPEQLKGEPIGVSTDIYSMGLLLCELLTEHHPFQGLAPLARLALLKKGEKVKPSALLRESGKKNLARQCEGDLDNLIMKAMHEQASERYHSAQQLADDVGNYLEDFPLIAKAPAFTYVFGKFIKRHKYMMSSLVTVFLVTLVALMNVIQSRDQVRQERDRARYISDFLEDIFTVSDPYFAKKNERDVTAKALLDKAYEKMKRDFSNTDVSVDLLETMGSAYMVTDADKANELLHQAYELYSEEEDLLRINLKRATIASTSGEYQKAVSLSAPLLDAFQTRGQSVDFINTTTILGLNLFKLGKHAQAQQVFLEGIQMYERNPCDQCPSLLRSYAYLGMAHLFLAEYEQAWAFLQKGERFAEKYEQLDHPAYSAILYNQGALMYSIYLSDDALLAAKASRANLDTTGRTYKVSGSDYLQGLIFERQMDFQNLEQIIQFLKKNRTDEFSHASYILYRLKGSYALFQGAYQQSEAHYLIALEILAQRYGTNSLTYGLMCLELAKLYQTWPCPEVQDQYLKEAFSILSTQGPLDSGFLLPYYRIQLEIALQRKDHNAINFYRNALNKMFHKLDPLIQGKVVDAEYLETKAFVTSIHSEEH